MHASGACHAYVDRAYLDRLPVIGAAEEEMLGFVAAERGDNSRLSCQIALTDALDRIVVRCQKGRGKQGTTTGLGGARPNFERVRLIA